MAEPQAQPQPTRLAMHFSGGDSSSHPSRWDSLWRQDFVPWDRGGPSPALQDVLADPHYRTLLRLPGTRTTADKHASGIGMDYRPCALVPGCGTGYDAHVLASAGFNVWAVDASEIAVQQAKKYAEALEMLREKIAKGEEQQEKELYPIVNKDAGRGAIKFLAGDFFAERWVKEIKRESEENMGEDDEWRGMDLIYDYTFLCALPLELRPKWALRMSRLLAPTGSLICLEFPTTKPTTSGGPPWALPSSVYVQLLSYPGEKPEYDDEGKIEERTDEPNELALKRIAHWQPARSHKTSFGPDWMSIWRHVKA